MVQWFLITFHCISLTLNSCALHFSICIFFWKWNFRFCVLKPCCFFVYFVFDLHPITVWVCIISIKQTALHSWELTLHYSAFTACHQCNITPTNRLRVARKKYIVYECTYIYNIIYRLNAMQRLYASMVATSFCLLQDFFFLVCLRIQLVQLFFVFREVGAIK